MNALIEKIKSLLIALGMLVVAGGGLWWLSHSIENYGDTLRERMQIVVNDAAFEEQFQSLSATAETAQQDQQELNSYILDDDRDTIALLSELDQIAAAQNVELSTNKLNETTTEEEGFNILSLSYNISGQESAVMRMIQIIETLPYDGVVTSLHFDRSVDEETGTTLAQALIGLELTIRSYD